MIEPNTFPRLEGWAVLQLFGFKRDVGFVEAVYFGNTSMFRVSRNARPSVERTLETEEYVNHRTCKPGTRLLYAALPAEQYLIGGAAIYSLTPCDEAEAHRVIEEEYPQPVTVLNESESESDDIPF